MSYPKSVHNAARIIVCVEIEFSWILCDVGICEVHTELRKRLQDERVTL